MIITKVHRRRIRKGVVTGVGGGVLVFGVVGLAIPVVPGSPIILTGLVILSTEYEWPKRTLLKIPQWINRVRGNLPNKKTAITTWVKNFIVKLKKKIAQIEVTESRVATSCIRHPVKIPHSSGEFHGHYFLVRG